MEPPAHGWAFDDLPPIRSDVDGAPVLIGEIEIDVSGMLGCTDMNGALWPVELRPGFQEIQRRADGRCARGLPSRLVMAAAQPAAEPLTAYRPGFPVVIDRDVGKRGSSRRVKQLAAQPNCGEYICC